MGSGGGLLRVCNGCGYGAVRACGGRMGGVSMMARVPEGIKVGLLVAGFFAAVLAADLLFALLSAYAP